MGLVIRRSLINKFTNLTNNIVGLGIKLELMKHASRKKTKLGLSAKLISYDVFRHQSRFSGHGLIVPKYPTLPRKNIQNFPTS